MPNSIEMARHHLVALTRESLWTLRSTLLRDMGPAAASCLQEAGYAGGEALFNSFRAWLSERGAPSPEELELHDFERRASEYFRDIGWGTLAIGALREAVGTLDSPDWAEADPQAGLDLPGCHFTTGVFADFFGRLADRPLGVLEVECRSAGANRCRFLLGSSEVLEHVFDVVERGESYERALEAVE